MRSQSPSNAHHYHYSPTRHRPNQSAEKGEKQNEQSKDETAEKKNTDNNNMTPSPQTVKNVVNVEITKSILPKAETLDKHLKGCTSEKNQSPDRKDPMSPKVDPSEKKTQSNTQDGDKKKGLFYTSDERIFVSLH